MSQSMTADLAPADMTAKKVLLCEDEIIVAMDLQLLIEDFGYEVLGPYPSLGSVMRDLDGLQPDVAVLDVSLQDGDVFPLADKLTEMGVQLVFQSGHVFDYEIQQKYPGAACCEKPIDTRRLREALTTAMAS